MPEALENVNTLVNCPVLDEENPTLTLTIANTGETSTSYQMPPILEVWLDDGWYVIPTNQYREQRADLDTSGGEDGHG